MNREQAVRHIRASALAKYAKRIEASLRPSVRLMREAVENSAAPLGGSRLGGAPDLPPGFEWPSWEIETRRGLFRKKQVRQAVLDFLAQLRLDELPAASLPEGCPRTGVLYVFYDAEAQPWGGEPRHERGSRVYHFDGDLGALERTEPPSGRADQYAPCVVTFTEEWTLPDYPHFLEEDGELDDAEVEEYMENVAFPINEGEVVHRMFGHPQAIQGVHELTADDPARHLLLQIDSDDTVGRSPGWMWGDVGRLYFTISHDELTNRDFASVRTTLQCF